MAHSPLQGLRILVTGHTGFKGSWLILLLNELGAEVIGISDEIRDTSLFSRMRRNLSIENHEADVRDFGRLEKLIAEIQPDGVFHLAAQPLVIDSYLKPLETFEVNIMGTANVIMASLTSGVCKFLVIVTTDKVYKNADLGIPFKESSPLGGHDPYSASKSAAEVITSALRNLVPDDSFPKIVTARAGNVIGGGDDAANRLLPDITRAILDNKEVLLRNPKSTRPWQHVLDPLMGYIGIAEKIIVGSLVSNEYNLGPNTDSMLDVEEVTKEALEYWGRPNSWKIVEVRSQEFKESKLLSLDSTKASLEIGWCNKLTASDAIRWTVDWESAVNQKGLNPFVISLEQVRNYLTL